TGMTLRSDVAVDNIHKIEILTTTRELLLGEPPEVCHIQAFDEEGNVFTSLEGIEFVWELKTVEGVGSVNAQSVLRFMLFEFSSYETSPEIYSLEEKNVAPAQVKVIVQDNVMLKPAHDVYIVVNTSITYSVVRLRQGKVTVVPMPSSQFELRLSNTTVGQLNVKQSSVMGIQSGYTKVTLVDKNMLHIHTGHQPAAGIYVVEPAYLGFSIVPHPDWVLQVGVEYEVSVQIYNADDRKIFISDNIHLSTSFPEAYFQLLWSSKNGSYHRVKTLQKTKRTVITAVYTSIEIPEKHTIHTFDRPISGKQEAEIFDPVVVIPEIVLFPWYPAAQKNVAEYKQFQYLLEPSGGSGTYIWTSSNTSVATVSTKGLVITTNAVGHSQIRASDTRNLANFGSSEVRSTGGPSPQAATLFEVANQTVATVSSVGLVEAQELGTTNLTGFVQASDPLKGQTFLFSKDVIIIRVIQLSGVKINVATTNLVTETKISMYAIGLNEETPFTFANAIPGLKFYWSSSNPDVCQVQSVYALSGVAVESENDFRVDLHCINPGQTTVQLRVEIADHRYQQAHSLALLEDDVTFEVYERLQLIFPASGFLLLPNNVNTKIKTNRDGSGSITYELITDCSQRTMGFNGPSVLTISKGGQVTSASLSGTAAVLVTVHEEFGINQTAVVHVEVQY
ncbi:PREDICTED: nuclear pore membrane glycoprotein 210-like, partial [Acropora digitifera]|uniref:nuclear pore membrane glycoprotein 210-like n=1 Tax=Acropora digitifera TaxID=70779 RepID=UPI00077AB835